MFSTRSEYDRGVNTFSPQGRLFQVEYALSAIKLGSTALGICTKEGVIVASERRIASCLLEQDSIKKILTLDDHACAAMSGLMADARTLANHAQTRCLHHRFVYNEPMPVESIVDSISHMALDFSDSGSRNQKKSMSRPYGVALLIAGSDASGPSLWCTDPSGTKTKYKAGAIGSAQEGAESMLVQHYKEDMTLQEAEQLALTTLCQVMEDKMNSSNIEMSRTCGKNGQCISYTKDEIETIIQRIAPTGTSVNSSSAPVESSAA